MTIEDIKITIKNHILNSISHQDLTALCNTFEIPITGRRIHIQKRLIDTILVTNNVDLLHRILLMLNRTISHNNANQMISSHTREAVHSYIHNGNLNMSSMNEIDCNNYAYNGIKVLNSKLYCISSETIEKCPIDLRREIVHGIDPMNIFIPNYTKYPNGYFNAPGASPTMANGRVNVQNIQLPYCIKNAVVPSSQFYCCQVVLHPLSLLIPKPTPNICQPTRVMSKMPLQFTLSCHARNLISYHRTEQTNRRIYKWQILIRFGMYDPSKPFPPSSNESISNLQEYIPPYLTLFVNNVAVPLWDILPSNSTAKEGKRHPRPINISDYLKFNNSNDNLGNNVFSNDPAGYRQSITVNWWQTPGVYQYYYFGVFLERKLAVGELIDRFVNRTHHIQMPISFTLDFIKEKFSSSSNRYTKEDDDLVISSVLPISLLCPVGKSRITCPLRGIHCQHLQCFDAHLYLMMNERRSVWKCPVCDSQATLNELFVDEYFLKIIQQFSNDDELTEVNVNPDGSFVPVAVKESREHKQHIGNIISNVNTNNNNTIGDEKHSSNNSTGDSSSTESNNPVILLESDEDEQDRNIKMSPKKPDLEPTISSLLDSNPSTENEFVLKPPQSKSLTQTVTIDLTSDSDDERETSVLNTFSKSDISPSATATFHNHQPLLSHHCHQNMQHNSQVVRQHLPHATIAPKVSANNYAAKVLEPTVGYLNPPLNYHQSSSPSVSNQFQSVVSSSSTSQSLSKVPPFIWLSPNPRFPQNCQNKQHLVNCFMPQLKQCYPNQNFVNMPQPMNTNFQVPTSNCVKVPLIPRAIKIDPHLNLSHPFGTNMATTSVHNSSVSVLQRKPKPPHKTRIKKSSSLSNSYARRSTRIRNQNKKVYKERSSSGDDMNSSDSDDGVAATNDAYDEDDNEDDDDDNDEDNDEEEDEDDDDEGEDDDDEEEDDFSKVVSVRRNKRRNAFDDSTSSNSSQCNRKRKRLVPDHLFDEESNNKERYVHNRLLGQQADIAANLKSPIVMLNKLDPLLLKVYLQQNEVSTQDSDLQKLTRCDDSTGLSISKASSRIADFAIHENSDSIVTSPNSNNGGICSIQNN